MPNKATAEIRALAQQNAPALVAELVRLATKAKSEQTRVAAIKELLDRGYGKATQPVTGGEGGEGALKIERIERVIVNPANRERCTYKGVGSFSGGPTHVRES